MGGKFGHIFLWMTVEWLAGFFLVSSLKEQVKVHLIWCLDYTILMQT